MNERSFSFCKSLESIDIPDKVTGIANGAFIGCTKMKEVKLSRDLIKIGDYAFDGCESLEYIELPDTLSYIENEAFKRCVSLKRIKLSANLQSAGVSAFKGCKSLVEILLPNNPTPEILRLADEIWKQAHS